MAKKPAMKPASMSKPAPAPMPMPKGGKKGKC